MSSSQDIDSMLDAALDELGDDSDEEDFRSKQSKATKITPEQPPVVQSSSSAAKVPPARPVMGPPRPPTGPAAAKSSPQKQQSPSSSATKTSDQIAEEMLSGWMQQMINAEEDPQARMDMLHAMNKAAAVSFSDPSTSPSKSSSSPLQPENMSTCSSPRNANRSKTAQHQQATEEVDDAISQLMEGMALETDDNDNDGDASPNHTEEEALLQQLLQGLQGAMDGDGANDDNSNPDALVDGMMEQLMSKDLMYEPMKQVSLEFPGWLETHKQDLSQAEFAQRQKQHQCFQQIVHIYDTEPNNTRKLVELMQEVQEFGQPPPEIIQKIAPGLELDGEGVPQMDFFSAMNEDDCKIS